LRRGGTDERRFARFAVWPLGDSSGCLRPRVLLTSAPSKSPGAVGLTRRASYPVNLGVNTTAGGATGQESVLGSKVTVTGPSPLGGAGVRGTRRGIRRDDRGAATPATGRGATASPISGTATSTNELMRATPTAAARDN